MIEDNYYLLIHKSITGEISDAERERLDIWLQHAGNQAVYDEMAYIFRTVDADDFYRPPDEDHFEEQAARLARNIKIVKQDELVRHQSSMLYRNIAMAILFIIAVTTGIGMLTQYRLRKTATMEMEIDDAKLTLPDSSRVTLGKRSKLFFRQSQDERHVTFTGNAFFDVKPDKSKPFIIQLPRGWVRVLGTSFFVETNENDTAKVIVVSGVVEVQNGGHTLYLTNGEVAEILPSGLVTKGERHGDNDTAWYTGKLEFENLKLRKILLLLERVYDVKFSASDMRLLSRRFTGTFDHQPIDMIMLVMSRSMNFNYKIENGIYVLHANTE